MYAAVGTVALASVAILGGHGNPIADQIEAPQALTRTAIRLHDPTDEQRREALAVALDVWSESPDATPLDLVVDAEAWRQRPVTEDFDVLVADIDAVATAERARLSEAKIAKPTPDEWFTEYRPYVAVVEYLQMLSLAYPDRARTEDIGTSIEGRKLRAIHLGTNPNAPTVVFNGGQHAREWISVMTTTCIADRLARGYRTDDRITKILDTTNVVIVPLVNPDGYEYSWTDDRYWRKNRRSDYGVDLNRNWPVAFGGRGSSKQPASPIYHGEHAFSEPESAALRDLIRRERPVVHIDFHSYSQLVLYPWGFSTKKAPDHEQLSTMAKRYAEVIRSVHGVKYTPKSGGALYPAGGTMMDWVYAERDTPSFVVELRPRRGDGFVLPPEQIEPTCEENFAAVLDLIERTAP